MKYHSALFFIPFLLSSVLAVDKTCYFPDGTVSPEDVPCNPNDDFSPCCGHQADGTSAFCLSNGLCMGNFKLSRGSCTDKGWSNINCAQQCQTQNPSGGAPITDCGTNNRWSCNDCTSSNFTFSATLNLNAAQKSALGVTDAANSSSSNSSSSSSSSSNPSSSNSSCSNSSSVQQTIDTNDGGPSATAVGAGVGVSLGCAFIAALILFFLEKRKNSALRASLNDSGASYQHLGEEQAYKSSKSPAYGWSGTTDPAGAPRAQRQFNELPTDQTGAMELQGTLK